MNKNTLKKQIFLAGLAFILLALLFGLWSHHNIHHQDNKELELKSGTAFPIPRTIKPFELSSAPGNQPFTNEQLKGQWSMLFFGFTHCAMLCPTTLSMLNQFYQTLQASHLQVLPQIYFISIDPERDSLDRVNQYVTSFNKNFKGLVGTEKQLASMTSELNILYAKVKPKKVADDNDDDEEDSDDYQIDHSGTVLLIDPQGHLAALFSPPLDPKALADDYKLILKKASK